MSNSKSTRKPRKRKSLEERFLAKVGPPDENGCWPWRGCTIGHNGVIGSETIPQRTKYAHRVAWEFANGPIPGDLFVCHSCDNPRCVNPDHLFLCEPKKFFSKPRKHKSLKERFLKKVGPPDANGCWNWLAGMNTNGYGVMGKLGHRVAWELFNGPIPVNMCVLHHCDNPRCVNPAHLFIGTQNDNMQDMIKKGRGATGDRHGSHIHPERVRRGELNGNAKLTEKTIRDIRLRYTRRVATAASLAAEYDIALSTTYRIIRRQSWKHIV